MRKFAVLIAVAVVGALAAPARAQQPAALEVRMQSLNDLSGYFEFVGNVLSQPDAAKQAAEFIKAFSTEKSGFEGIDPAKPLGMYADITKDVIDSPIVLMLPIVDSDVFLDLLRGKIGLQPKKKDGVYQMDVPNIPAPVFFRFAKGYAYFTVLTDKAIAEKSLKDPAAFFAGKQTNLATATMNLDRIPTDVKKTIVAQVELKLADSKKVDGETPAQTKLRGWAYDQLAAALNTALTDGKELTVKLAVDPKTDDAMATVNFTAKDGTELSKVIQSIESRPGAAALLTPGKNPLAAGTFKFNLTAASLKSFEKVFDALVEEAIDKAADRNGTQMVLDAIVPTYKLGEYEMGAVLTGPDATGKFGLVLSSKAAEGEGIVKLFKELAKVIPAQTIAFDFDEKKVGNLNLHKITVFEGIDLDAMFGSKTVWMATSDNLFLLSFEPDAKAITAAAEAMAKGGKVRPAIGELSVSRLVELTEKTVRKETIQELIDASFGKDGPTGRDTLKLSVDGGKSLSVKLNVKGSAVKLMGLLDAEKKKKP